jgi:hypothetical protein
LVFGNVGSGDWHCSSRRLCARGGSIGGWFGAA